MKDYMWKYAQKNLQNFHQGLKSNFVESWLDNNFDKMTQQPEIDKEDFLLILRDLLIAGSETTTTSLKWTVIHMANNPKIQAQIHEQIDQVVGKDRPIRLSDRKQLPLVEALVWEVQRFNTIVASGLPHYTKTGLKLGEYDIPAGTFLILNLHSVHMNEKTFGDPEVFRPGRFIDDEGNFVKHPHVIPFAVGKRTCLGELLARQELFIFTAALLQNFEFKPPEGVDKIDDTGVVNFTNAPKPFRIRSIPR